MFAMIQKLMQDNKLSCGTPFFFFGFWGGVEEREQNKGIKLKNYHRRLAWNQHHEMKT